MTKEQKEILCRLYNNYDNEALMYIKNFITEEQRDLYNTILKLYYKIFGKVFYPEENLSDEIFEKYNECMWSLLRAFGLEIKEGRAYFEGIFYF